MSTATPSSYFDRMWARSDDPWEHGTRWYEARKYDLTVASLRRDRYASAFEPGCGAGFLTRRLAERCDRLVATERDARGVAATADRCGGRTGVEVRQGRLPDDWPDGPLDLVVVSEVLYYLDDGELDAVLARLAELRGGGTEVVAVHYRRAVAEHVRLGDEVHRRLRDSLGAPATTHLEADFVLDGFGDPGG